MHDLAAQFTANRGWYSKARSAFIRVRGDGA